MSDDRASRIGLWIGVALGGPVMAYGVWWLLHNSPATKPPGWAITLASAAGVHDLVLVPVLLAGWWVLRRVAPDWLRPVVVTAFAVSGVLALYAVPVVSRYGERPSNPTLLPHDYGRNLVIVLAVVWGVAAVAAAWQWRVTRAG